MTSMNTIAIGGFEEDHGERRILKNGCGSFVGVYGNLKKLIYLFSEFHVRMFPHVPQKFIFLCSG
jgi:sulfatase maturation enzyme AslB (radical SAM superfamily)